MAIAELNMLMSMSPYIVPVSMMVMENVTAASDMPNAGLSFVNSSLEASIWASLPENSLRDVNSPMTMARFMSRILL